MRARFKRLDARLRQLFGAVQSSVGTHSVQVGNIAGDLTVIHIQQLDMHAMRPACESVPGAMKEDAYLQRRRATVFALMDGLRDDTCTIKFMRQEFDTIAVADLDFPQLSRLRRFIELMIQREALSVRTTPCRG